MLTVYGQLAQLPGRCWQNGPCRSCLMTAAGCRAAESGKATVWMSLC
ncbi:hypothetical protein PhaeoP78_00251 [Phaeobacter inhibens]|nr:hypothetical protein PhaeoP78_00251 [Phaeobacter inhibens]